LPDVHDLLGGDGLAVKLEGESCAATAVLPNLLDCCAYSALYQHPRNEGSTSPGMPRALWTLIEPMVIR